MIRTVKFHAIGHPFGAALALALLAQVYGGCGASSDQPDTGTGDDDDAGGASDVETIDTTIPPTDGNYGPDQDADEVCVPAPAIVTGSWTERGAQAGAEAGVPSARGYAGMAFGPDGQRSLALLFGGGTVNSGLLQDTWGFDPSMDAWSRLSDGPSARGGLAVSFAGSADAGAFVMFGGVGTTYFGDTWAFQSGWTNVCTPDAGACGCGPCARAYHAMAFDAVHRLVVMFGGSNATDPMADTWVMSSDRHWQQRCAVSCLVDGGQSDSEPAGASSCCVSPPARSEHAMAFDAARGVVVLFGGKAADGSLLGDTWEWDGNAWTERQTAHSPTPRAGLAMASAPRPYGVVAFGGSDANGLPTEPLWTFDGSDWSPVVVDGPAPISRPFGVMTNVGDGGAFLFGGGAAGEYNDAWTLTLATETPLEGGCPELPDAASPEAGPPDAASPEAGPPDAASPEAGPVVDAVAPDAP